jgi:hypothetical protein
MSMFDTTGKATGTTMRKENTLRKLDRCRRVKHLPVNGRSTIGGVIKLGFDRLGHFVPCCRGRFAA